MNMTNEYGFIKRTVGSEPYERDEIAVVKMSELEEVRTPNEYGAVSIQWRLRTKSEKGERVLIFDDSFTGNFDGTLYTNHYDIDRFYDVVRRFRDTGFSKPVNENGLKISKPNSPNDWASFVIRDS